MILRLSVLAAVIGLGVGGWLAYTALHGRLDAAKADAITARATLEALVQEQQKANALADARAAQDAKMIKQLSTVKTHIREIIRHEPCANTLLPAAVLERLR